MQSCITGVANTTISVDWVRGTLPDSHDAMETAKALCGAVEGWRPSTPRFGYRNAVGFGRTRIHYNGGNNTVCLDITGEGCRELEHRLRLRTLEDWQSFFARCQDHRMQMTRIDWAIDNMDGLLTMAEMHSKLESGNCRTRFRTAYEQEAFTPQSGQKKGSGIRFGSRSSSMCVRIYDKSAQYSKSKVNRTTTKNWIRVEIESKNKMAARLMTEFINTGPRAICDDLMARIKFVDAVTDRNKSRWPVCGWWARFLGASSGALIRQTENNRTLAQVADSIENQYGPYLFILMESPDFGSHWLDEMLQRSETRVNERHSALL